MSHPRRSPATAFHFLALPHLCSRWSSFHYCHCQHKLLAASLTAATGNLTDLSNKLDGLTLSRQRAHSAVEKLTAELGETQSALEKEKGRPAGGKA